MNLAAGLSIKGLGHYLPLRKQSSGELDVIFGQENGWTQKKFHINNRYIANESETTSFMATQACLEALKSANWEIGDFDMLIGACAVMEQPIPSTSVFVQQKLGLENSGIICFDTNMTCLSFLTALDIAGLYIASGRIKRAVIFSSEIASCGLNYEVPETSAIFGDGAAAICVEAGINGGILATKFETYSSGIETSHLRSGGTRIRIGDYENLVAGAKFYMNPTSIFRTAGRKLPKLIDDILVQAGLKIEDIEIIIPHQASGPGIEYLKHIIKGAEDKIIDIFAQCGNQIAASLPMSLYFAGEQGRLKSGTNALLIGTAAGVSLGAIVLKL